MAITYVDDFTYDLPDNTGGTYQDISLPVSQENDVWVVACSYDTFTNSNTFGTQAVADGWTKVDDFAANPSGGVLIKRMGATPDTTVAIEESTNATDGTGAVIGQLFRGVDTDTILDVARTEGSGSTEIIYTPSITPVTDGAQIVIIGALDDDTVSAPTVPTNYSNQTFNTTTGTAGTTSGDTSIVMASRNLATAAAEDPGNWTMASADGNSAMTLALRPAAGGGSSSILPLLNAYYG